MQMPPKPKFSKEAIIDAAFDIARVEGMEAITIRKVADRMGSSIAPIYVNFQDIADLKKAVALKINAISQEMLAISYSPNPFLNMGIASMKFARAYSVLFKDLVMNSNRYLQDIEQPTDDLLGHMTMDRDLDGFTKEELMGIFFKMKVFQVGLSVMDVTGMLPPDFSEEQLIGLLESTGTDIIAAARMRQDGEIGGNGVED